MLRDRLKGGGGGREKLGRKFSTVQHLARLTFRITNCHLGA